MSDRETCIAVVAAVRDAGRAALEVYSGDFDVHRKDDHSPVTEADLRVHDILTERLPDILGLTVLSEESADNAGTTGREFWLVDPLDGTKEFIKKTGEFTVNVALIRDGAPVMGVVHAPAIGVTWWAAVGIGAFEARDQEEFRAIAPRVPAGSPLRVAVSRDHVSDKDRELLLALEKIEAVPMGSSLKFCRVASGEADLYVRFGRTMEWDTGAAQCVVESAGGRVVDLSGQRLSYGKAARDNPSFLCFADPRLEYVVETAARVGSR